MKNLIKHLKLSFNLSTSHILTLGYNLLHEAMVDQFILEAIKEAIMKEEDIGPLVEATTQHRDTMTTMEKMIAYNNYNNAIENQTTRRPTTMKKKVIQISLLLITTLFSFMIIFATLIVVIHIILLRIRIYL